MQVLNQDRSQQTLVGSVKVSLPKIKQEPNLQTFGHLLDLLSIVHPRTPHRMSFVAGYRCLDFYIAISVMSKIWDPTSLSIDRPNWI